jgi:O-antigen/teichoic acid export membrane protein
MQRILPKELLKYINDKLPYDTLRYRFAKGMFWTVVGNIVVAVLAIVLSILNARMLGQVGFGELAMIRSTVEIFGIFAGFGLGITATKYISEFKNKDTEKAGRVIGLTNILAIGTGLIASLVLLVFATYISRNIINAPHLSGEIKLSCGLLFFSTLAGAQYGALTGFEAFKVMARNSASISAANFIFVLLGTYRWGLKGAISGLVISSSISCVVNYVSLKKIQKATNIKTNYNQWHKEAGVLWKFSLPSLLSNVMISPIQWVINAIMVNTAGGYAELGLFNAANQWRNSLLIFPRWAGQTVTPILSDKYGTGDKKSVRQLILINLAINLAVVIPAAIIIVFGKNIIMQSYGKSFAGGNTSLLILALSAVFIAIQMPLGHTIAASGKMWLGFILNGITGLTLIGIFFVFKEKGALGLSYAYLIAYLLHIVWTLLLTRNLVHTQKTIKHV